MTSHRRLLLGVPAALAIGVGALTGPASSAATPSPAVTTTTSLAQHPGKILAGNCFQCHGTDGVNGPFDSLAGESATELFDELKELQTEMDLDEAIMRIHALGYTDEQLRLIADYFSRVPTGR